MSFVRVLTASRANVSAVVFIAGTTSSLLQFQANGDIALLQAYFVLPPLCLCCMLSVPCSGYITSIDIVCMCAQADGTNRVGSGVCTVGKILVTMLIELVTMRA